MSLFISKFISSIIQIILFSLIPFIWWFITAKNEQSFTQWVGLKKISGNKSKITKSIIIVSLFFELLGIFILYITKGIATATSDFYGMGITAMPAIIIYAAFNTALPEELLFRGFLLKRLNHKFSFHFSNFVQALLFGLLHGVMFFSLAGVIKTILIIIFTGAIAWFMGYINEKIADGSIIPSWIIHTISNLLAGIFDAFVII